MKKDRLMSLEGLKKAAIVVFVAGFFFNQLLAAIGAITWGLITLKELFGMKK